MERVWARGRRPRPENQACMRKGQGSAEPEAQGQARSQGYMKNWSKLGLSLFS